MFRLTQIGRPLVMLCFLFGGSLSAFAGHESPPKPKTAPAWGYTVNGGCECGNGRYCTGPKGGKYCLKNGRKQYL
ncbi:hypothetical protein VX159_07930 [Dechloromonas sp. ZY10]|uniref:hypothetical protein n=1 Tax=Dechloromonas aquae TaxID=2664436 RepID=UPI003527F7E2